MEREAVRVRGLGDDAKNRARVTLLEERRKALRALRDEFDRLTELPYQPARDDGVEISAGTDPCGPGQPSYPTQPKLVLAGKTMYRFTAPTNSPSASPQTLQIYNLGAGTMNWTATGSLPAFRASPSNTCRTTR